MKTKGIKKLICLTLSLLMMSACFASFPVNAYVSKTTEASPNTVYAPIALNNIKAYNGGVSVDVNENGYYQFTSTGAFPIVEQLDVPNVDAAEYCNIVMEISAPSVPGRTVITVKYSDGTTVPKGASVPAHGEGEWVEVSFGLDAKADGITIKSLNLQPWNQQDMTGRTETYQIRCIKFVKNAAADIVYSGDIESNSGTTVTKDVTFDGEMCTLLKPDASGDWMSVKFDWSSGTSTATYKYAVVEMYYGLEQDGTAPNAPYPMFRLYEYKTESTGSINYTGRNLYPGKAKYGYDLTSDYRQANVYNAWHTYVFPLDNNYDNNGLGSDGVIHRAGLQFTNSGTPDIKIYIKSVKYMVEAPKEDNITITPNLNSGVTVAGVGDTVFATNVFDDRLVWEVGKDTASGGALSFGGVNVPVSAYNYVLVNCYYTGTAGGVYPQVRITGSDVANGFSTWYNLFIHKGEVSSSEYSKDTRVGVTNAYGKTGRWMTLAFPILDTNVIATDGGTFTETASITNFIVQLHGDGQTGDRVYVSSVTFSATPVPVVDKKVDDEIIFRGAQDGLVPSATNDFRFVATIGNIDLSLYSAVGFDIVRTADNFVLDISGKTVYSSIKEDTSTGLNEVSAEKWNDKYIVALVFKGVPVRPEAIELVVTPYLLRNDNTKDSGMSAKITIVNGNIVSCTLEVE